MSVPFNGREFTFNQPDGTPLTVRGWGNQHHAVFETLNGYTVVEDPATGFYTYADLSPDGEDLIPTGALPRVVNPQGLGISRGIRTTPAAARARAQESSPLAPGTSRWEVRRREQKLAIRRSAEGDVAFAPPQRETVGDFVGLCVLIQFPDVPATISRDEVDRFCNQPGYRGFGNNGSVQEYFRDVSGGKLNYTNVVAPYYTARHPRRFYTNENIAQPTRTRQLIKEALDFLRAQAFDFSRLTTDDQGFVYATNVFYAGTRVNRWGKGLWPHAYHLLTPYKLKQGKNAFDYQITDMTDELTLGTFCHENGHMVCDFPDLYDYGDESAGVGAFCLMCAGANIREKDPTDINAYLKFRAGWAKVNKITQNMNATVKAGSNQFLIHRKNPTEYFILENRNKRGRDKALPGRGLAIWHIDELGDNRFEHMTAAQHYECSLVQADGRNDLETDPRNLGDETDLFGQGVNDRFGPDTSPASTWWDGTPSGLAITSVSAPGDVITFQARI